MGQIEKEAIAYRYPVKDDDCRSGETISLELIENVKAHIPKNLDLFLILCISISILDFKSIELRVLAVREYEISSHSRFSETHANQLYI